jgi:hypothetical protein
MLLRTKQRGDAILLRANKRGMLCFSEHTNGGCYISQKKTNEDAILLRAYKRGMLYFSEQNKQGMPCFSEHINGG